MRVWDYYFELTAYILTFTCNPHILFGDQTGYQIIIQLKPDISQYASFYFYSWVWHWDKVSKQKVVGHSIGVAKMVGPSINFWILPISGIPILRFTVINTAPGEYNKVNIKVIMDDFTKTITSKLCSISKHMVPPDNSIPFRKIGQTSSVSDLWDGDINMVPYEPTSE